MVAAQARQRAAEEEHKENEARVKADLELKNASQRNAECEAELRAITERQVVTGGRGRTGRWRRQLAEQRPG